MADYTSATPKLLKTKNQLGTSYGMTGASPIKKNMTLKLMLLLLLSREPIIPRNKY
nr:hypothetical protein QOL21_04055 [Acholeplasma laidlawii]